MLEVQNAIVTLGTYALYGCILIGITITVLILAVSLIKKDKN